MAFVVDSFGYTASQLQLGSLGGEQVRFRFGLRKHGDWKDLGWFIDDIRIYQCEPINGTIPSHTLSGGITGTGGGTVFSMAGDIACPSDCSADLIEGTNVVLNTAPDVGSKFDGWSGGGCSGTGTCLITMDQAYTVTATFTSVSPVTLTINRVGEGSGTITSTDSGIDCGTDCTESYEVNSVVTLTGTPEPGSYFGGWIPDGVCDSGNVPMTVDITCTPQFNLLGSTTRVSVSSSGEQTSVGKNNEESSISADGRYVVFSSDTPDLVAGDPYGWVRVFLHDRETGSTSRVSVSNIGEQGNSISLRPRISANGGYVAFQSRASNLVSGDTNAQDDIFVHDRKTGSISRVSVASDGKEGNGQSTASSISADGHYVAFSSSAFNLVSGDTNNSRDIFVHDRETGSTSRVSIASSGEQANAASYQPWISADGRYVVFESLASNLVAGDTNSRSDIFVHDQETGIPELVAVKFGDIPFTFETANFPMV